jgi:voltage-gated sodium channel type XI alpha
LACIETIQFEDYSFFILGHQNQFRLLVVKIVVNQWFDAFILAVIIANAILFAQADYSHVDSTGALISKGSLRNTALDVLDLPFLVVFTIESLLKSIAMGFVGWHGAYMSDPWSWLDMLVVTTGWLTASKAPISNLSAIRAFRIFRALRALKMGAIPGTVALATCLHTKVDTLTFFVL